MRMVYCPHMAWLKKAMGLVLSGALLASGLAPLAARAAVDPENLFPDSELERADAMTPGQIAAFLANKGGLGQLSFQDVDGATRSAAEIVWRVAQDYRINPKFLLALLQREQSLVETARPSQYQLDWAVGYARCDSCDVDHPLVAAYRGFARQLEGAAARIRGHYLADLARTGTTQTGWGPGITKVVDGLAVTPLNRATAILYTYTPHLNGNLNFARILKRWFEKEIPDGTVVRSEDGKRLWLISGGQRRLFGSMTAYLSRYSTAQAVTIRDAELDDYEEGAPIRFPNYSLLHEPDGTIWLLDGDTLRHISSMEVFRKIGFSLDELLEVERVDLEAYAVGEPVTLASAYPTGALLQDNTTGGVWWVKEGRRAPIVSREIMLASFPGRRVSPVSPRTLEGYEVAPPLTFKDGTLIGAAGDPSVYVVSKGKRRPIVSEEAFRVYGWDFANVVWTNHAALAVHPLGEAVDVRPTPEVLTAGF